MKPTLSGGSGGSDSITSDDATRPQLAGSAASAIRLGYSPLTERIYAGKMEADGHTMRDAKTDVTSDVLAAIKHYCPPGKERIIRENGKPAYLLQVLPLSNAQRERPAQEEEPR